MTDERTADERLDDLERRMGAMENAFPNKDPESHRRYHEELIEQNRDRKALIRAVREKTIAGLVWSALFAVGVACWHYIVDFIRKGP